MPATSEKTAHSSRLARLLNPDVRNLPPAYFAMVMATGIVSLSCWQTGWKWLGAALFVIAVLVYLLLWWLTVLRLIWFRHLFFTDMIDHIRGPGFFTMVAASGVLGSEFLTLLQSRGISTVLLGLAMILWFVLTYTIFTALTIKEEKPTLDKGISGAWLLAVVATQSVAVLSAFLAVGMEQPYRLDLNFIALAMWLGGGMLYIWMMSLIFYRYTFFHFAASDLSPPYWINMGAMAISTLAGSALILNSENAPLLESITPFMKGFTIFFWATGTWWIPMLVILGIWRHVFKRFPFQYDPLYWGAVFPLGMYSVATRQMSLALELPFLMPLAGTFTWISLGIWAVVFIGCVRTVLRGHPAAAV
ncbi:MAG: tellurite resistance/C4-dicarboxylate transporter family protein [Paracoccus sp. (in: a-proteobacteria)]